MIEVFGYSLSILTLAQVITTFAIVGIYAALTSLGEQRADHQSDCQMAILVAFVTDEHPRVQTLSHVVEIDDNLLERSCDELTHFSTRFRTFKAHGTLPSLQNAATTNVTEHLLAFLLSPYLAVATLFRLREEHRCRVFRLRSTEIRKNHFSKFVFLAFSGLVYILTGIALVGSVAYLPTLLIIAGAITVISVVAVSLKKTLEQQAWKAYWNDKLLEILAVRDRDRAHDQFNRALLLSNQLAGQPDVPFPGRLALYTGIYSAVQGLILLVEGYVTGL